MKSSKPLVPLLGFGIFGGAVWVIQRQLSSYRYRDILDAVGGVPLSSIALALVLTGLSYVVLTGYDFLGLRYARRTLPYRKTALASFVGYGFSQSLGFPLLTGAPVRYRFYSAWGLSAVEVTSVVAFYIVTYLVGFASLGGMVFLFQALPMVEGGAVAPTVVQPLGVLLLLGVGTYLLWCHVGNRPLTVKGWTLPSPSLSLAGRQIALGIIDWTLAASVLYVLLPSGIDFPFLSFLGIFLLAQISGVISQVPGGLGVFEAIVLVLLPEAVPEAAAIGSLLVWRGVYFVLPLVGAVSALGIFEGLRRRAEMEKVAGLLSRGVSAVAPNILAVTTFIAGGLLLISGATPAPATRLAWLNTFLPLPVLELSHFLGSVVGAALLVLAVGLQRRLDGAFHLAWVLLLFGVFFSLLRGFNYEEAIVLSLFLGALVSSRREFYRKASLTAGRFSTAWGVAVAGVILTSLWLGQFAYQQEYSSELWWQFTLTGGGPRFLRASVGAVAVLMVFFSYRLLRPEPARPVRPTPAELEELETVVAASPRASAALVFLRDKSVLRSESGRSFVMYGVQRRSWVALGDPVGPQEEWEQLIWRFREMVDRHSGWPIFYQVRPERISLYLDAGLTVLKLGEEARVPLDDFSLDGSSRKGLRKTVGKLEREGCTFEVVPRSCVPELLDDLEEISNQWIRAKEAREKSFSLGYFSRAYLSFTPLALVRQEGRIIAFANVFQGAGNSELSADLMRYRPDAPGGTMDYLFTRLMLWGSEAGYARFNLGMAPLSGMDSHPLAPVWSRFGRLIFRYGDHFYSFKGLRQYKEKFDPVWEPKYLASPGGLALPAVLADVATLIDEEASA